MRLEPLAVRHAAGLAFVGSEHPKAFEWTSYVPLDEDQAREWVQRVVDDPSLRGFAQVRQSDAAVVGHTALRTLSDRELEGGMTWVAPPVRSTPLVVEAKVLLLDLAFITLGADRVQFSVDQRNVASRTSLTRLGATLIELRENDRPSWARGEEGRSRNSALYAIRAREWEAVRAYNVDRLANWPR